jgi:transposase-like protein
MDSSKTGSGCRRRTPEQRQRLVTRFHRSKLTQRDFAARHGIGLSTLNKWLRLERDVGPAKVSFQEVRLPTPTPRWPIEVVSPQGWIVRLQNSSELPTLPQLLRTLPC